jgi:C4-dicarboxylate-specific signal transduction histidine kinase
MKYRIDSGSGPFSLSTASFANSLCQEKERIFSVRSVMPKSITISTVLMVLKKALSEVKANCSDSKLRADHQKKIAEQKDEIAERRRDLQEAKEKGDADKIAKREKKLKEAQDDLKALEARDY